MGVVFFLSDFGYAAGEAQITGFCAGNGIDWGYGATPNEVFVYAVDDDGFWPDDWQVIMDTPLARMVLERGGSFGVGLEDWATGPSNLEQMERAKEIIDAVGRPVVTGAEEIEYLDIPFAATRPK